MPTTVSPTIQPAANAGPVARARGVPSIRTIAMIGTGLIATPTARGRMSPIAAPTPTSQPGIPDATGHPRKPWPSRP